MKEGRKKKKKKHKRRKETRDCSGKIKNEKKVSSVEIVRKPDSSDQIFNNTDFVISSEDENRVAPAKGSITTKKGIEIGLKSDAGKIIIKCLKDSKTLEEAQKRSEQFEDGECSDLTLSDEETYIREKEELNRLGRNSYDHRRDGGCRRSRSSGYHNIDRPRNQLRRCWRKSRSRSRSRSPYKKRYNSGSRSRRPDDLIIDKKRLLEIARKNAISMFKNGSLPGTQSMPQDVKNKVLMKMRYGGKTVEELTAFCKKLSNGENFNDLSSLSSNEDSDYDKQGNDKPFHHPFVLKDRGPIVMNIKNATPIPPKTAEQTKAILLQFPVSSGQQHKLNEKNEWIPVPATKPNIIESTTNTSLSVVKRNIEQYLFGAPPKKNIFEKPLPAESQPLAFIPIKPPEIAPATQDNEIPNISNNLGNEITPAVPESVFPKVQNTVDVTSIIAKRLNAMRKLQENPTDPEALKMMYNSQRDMSEWATSKTTPGQFTGSTGVNVLSARELMSGQQAWARRDQLTSTTPVFGGMGMHLLQKMGWKPGEGLGKSRNGSLQPLLLELKLDKRGLLAREEDPVLMQIRNRKKRTTTAAEVQLKIENKHPINLLGELSAKRKWGPPSYQLVDEGGPPHRKSFTYKVVVNGMMYQPAITSNTKKDAKALAAKYCLQQIGILPT